MNLSFNLYRLQVLDSKASQVKTRLAEIQAILASDSEIAAAQEAVDAARSALAAEQKKLRDLAQQHAAKKMKFDLNQSQLFGGKVRNPKELQDLQNEAEFLKNDMANLDEAQLTVMETQDLCQADLDAAETSLSETLKRKAGENSKLLGEKGKLEEELANLQAQRPSISSQLPAEAVEAYDALLTLKGGRAVAEVEDDSCTICGMRMTPAEAQAARSPKTLVRCRSCGRILYRT